MGKANARKSQKRRRKLQRNRQRREKQARGARRGVLLASGISRIRKSLEWMGSSLVAWFWWGWAIVGAIAVVIQVVSYAQSRLAVVPREPLDPNAPFSVPFIIENRGYLPCYDLAFQCVVRDLQGKAGESVKNLFVAKEDEGYVGDLPADGQTTISCDFVIARISPIQSADIDIVIRYRPAFFLWSREQKVRFITAATVNGNLIWLPQLSLPEE